jgi:hypothetical protein
MEEVSESASFDEKGKALKNAQELKNFFQGLAEAAKVEIVSRFIEKYPEKLFSMEISSSLDFVTEAIKTNPSLPNYGLKRNVGDIIESMLLTIKGVLTPEEFESLQKGSLRLTN